LPGRHPVDRRTIGRRCFDVGVSFHAVTFHSSAGLTSGLYIRLILVITCYHGLFAIMSRSCCIAGPRPGEGGGPQPSARGSPDFLTDQRPRSNDGIKMVVLFIPIQRKSTSRSSNDHCVALVTQML
jgi:hypothetical protein